MIDVSIIVPFYNTQKYLKNCVLSISQQTMANIEVIFVDDCSTDGSAEIVAELIKGDDRFCLYRLPENSGPGGARNYGILKATGKYIMFVDSDDMFPIDAVELLHTKALQENSDMVIGNMCVRNGHKLWPQDYIQSAISHMRTAPYPNIKDCDISFMFAGSPVNRIYKRELFQAGLSFRPKIYWEDMLFSLEAWHYAKFISYIPNYIYIRTIRDMNENNASITQRYTEKHFTDRSILLEEMYSFCIGNKQKDERLIQFTRHLINRFAVTTANMMKSDIIEVDDIDRLQVWFTNFIKRKDEIILALSKSHESIF